MGPLSPGAWCDVCITFHDLSLCQDAGFRAEKPEPEAGPLAGSRAELENQLQTPLTTSEPWQSLSPLVLSKVGPMGTLLTGLVWD